MLHEWSKNTFTTFTVFFFVILFKIKLFRFIFQSVKWKIYQQNKYILWSYSRIIVLIKVWTPKICLECLLCFKCINAIIIYFERNSKSWAVYLVPYMLNFIGLLSLLILQSSNFWQYGCSNVQLYIYQGQPGFWGIQYFGVFNIR